MDKRTCKNDGRFTFTGKESSPRGLGYCAEAEVVGTRMEGRDKTQWMVIIKNGVHVWTRVPTELVPEEPLIAAGAAAAATPKKKVSLAIPEIDDADTAESTPMTPHESASASASASEAERSRPASPVKALKPVAATAAVATTATAAKATKATKAPTAAKASASKPSADATPAKTKTLTDFHFYMKYRMATMPKDTPNRFAQAAKDWKSLTPETKAEEIAKAREMFA